MMPAAVTFRTTPISAHAMYKLPDASTTTATGELICAEVAGPPSPENPLAPVPATVRMMPSGVTFRTRWLLGSAMYRSPAVSTATSAMPLNCAEMAGPPSPAEPRAPVPATVVITPAALTLRTRLLPSAMYRLAAASTATSFGSIPAEVDGPPSPLAE